MAKLTSTVASRLVAQALGKDAKFIIVQLGKGEVLPVYDYNGQLLKFQTGAKAAAHAELLTRELGIKHQPRPVNDDEWREREETRMKAKDYLALPWMGERWWQDLKPIWGDHYPHASVDKEAFLAFTESVDKGTADIQTRIKPGRYLERFFGDPGILSSFVIRDLCAKFSNKYEENIVHYASTADEFEEVYITGPSSCMSKSAGNYPTKEHPVRMYAAGDLQVAYLKRDGRPSARVIIWPEKKQYNSTIYGDAARLRPLLQKMGYREGALEGARLRIKKVSVQPGISGAYNLVIPHVDHCPGIYAKDGHLIIGRAPGDSNGNRTISFAGGSGYTELVVDGCPKCDSKGDPQPVRGLAGVVNGLKDNGIIHMCASCKEKHAFRDRYSGVWVSNEFGVMANVGGRKAELVWSKWRGSYVHEAEDGELYDKSLLVHSEGKNYTAKYAKEKLTQCECGKFMPKEGCDAACKKKWEKAKLAYATTRLYTSNATTTWRTV